MRNLLVLGTPSAFLLFPEYVFAATLDLRYACTCTGKTCIINHALSKYIPLAIDPSRKNSTGKIRPDLTPLVHGGGEMRDVMKCLRARCCMLGVHICI